MKSFGSFINYSVCELDKDRGLVLFKDVTVKFPLTSLYYENGSFNIETQEFRCFNSEGVLQKTFLIRPHIIPVKT